MDERLFQDTLEQYRLFVRSSLAHWHDQLSLTQVLDRLDEKSVAAFQNDEPRTIRITFLALPAHKLWKTLFYTHDNRNYLPEHFPNMGGVNI